MKNIKTDAQAEEFAQSLPDAGDADLFRSLWITNEESIIRGHFPAFFVWEKGAADTEALTTAAVTAIATTGDQANG